MGKLADCAVHKFTEKRYNCCQAVICAVCEEYGVAELDAFKMTEGFGAGMGGLGDTCGAVTGLFLSLSLANSAGDMEKPRETKMDTYKKVRAAAEAFKEFSFPRMGMRTRKSQFSVTRRPMPSPSLPMTMAAGPLRSAS